MIIIMMTIILKIIGKVIDSAAAYCLIKAVIYQLESRGR